MPASIGALIATTVGLTASTTIVGSLTVGTLLGDIAITGALVGLDLLLSPTVPSPSQKVQATINQSTSPRLRLYGKGKLAGTRAFFESSDGKLYQIIMLAQGELADIVSYWIGDKSVTVESDGLVSTTRYAKNGDVANGSFAQLSFHSGTDSQTSDTWINTAFDEWTSAHRLRGIAYLTAIFEAPGDKFFVDVWPQSYNTPVRVVAHGEAVSDPRTSPPTIAWSDNPSLCILDYLQHADGARVPASKIDTASFADFADLCDEAVTLNAGGTESRYRLWGTYALTDAPADVLARMLATCDGELYQTAAGKIAIRGGQWVTPTVTLTDDDIISFQISDRDVFSRFNELKPIYTDSRLDYQSTEADAWVDIESQAAEGVLTKSLQLDLVPTFSQARRLAKIAFNKGNPAWTGSLVTRLTGLKLFEQQTVQLTIADFDVDDTFLVTSLKFNPANMTCEIGFSSLASTAYDWDPATEEGAQPPVPQTIVIVDTIEVPSNLTLAVASKEITAGVFAPTVTATVDAPSRGDLQLEAQYMIDGGTVWAEMAVADGVFVGQSGVLVDGSDYDVRARFTNGGRQAGDWAATQSITAVADDTAPAAVTLFGSSVSGSDVMLTWKNSASHYYATDIYRGATTTFADATVVDSEFGSAKAVNDYTDTPGSGTFSYWAVARNTSGVESTAAGPETVTV